MTPKRSFALLIALSTWPFALWGNSVSGEVTNEPQGDTSKMLSWAAGNMPPHAWENENGRQGFAYELVVEMARLLGRNAAVEFYPWARAIRMAELSKTTGAFPVTRTPEREDSFRWLIPIGKNQYTVFGRSDEKSDLHDPGVVRNLPVGVLRGSPHVISLKRNGFAHVIEGADYKDLLRMLQGRVIRVIYASNQMLTAAIKLHGYRDSDFRRGYALQGLDLYIVAPLSVDASEADRWLHAYQLLEQNGTLARLRIKYSREGLQGLP